MKKILLLSAWSGDIDDERKLRHYYIIRGVEKEKISHIDLVVEGTITKKGKSTLSGSKSFIYYSFGLKIGKQKFTKLLSRVFNMMSYILYALYIGIKTRKTYDTIWVSSPHPGASIAGIIVGKLFKKEIIYEIRDPWPELLIDLSIINEDSILSKVLKKLDIYLQKNAKYIISAFYDLTNISETYKSKVIIVPNSISDEVLNGIPYIENKKDHETLNLIYAGGAANAYMLDIIFKAIEKVVTSSKINIVLNLYVDEKEKKRYLPLVTELRIEKYIKFHSKVIQSKLIDAIQKSDYYIFHLKDLYFFRAGISSNKMMDPLMCGRPIIMAANLQNNWVMEANAGLIVKPEDPQKLATAIINSYDIYHTKQYDNMCKNAYNYARRELSVSARLKQLKEFGVF